MPNDCALLPNITELNNTSVPLDKHDYKLFYKYCIRVDVDVDMVTLTNAFVTLFVFSLS
jgi:hypothetical protein